MNPNHILRRRMPVLALAGVAVLGLIGAACTDSSSDIDDTDSESGESSLEVRAASTRPEMVTGGNVLIEVSSEDVDSVLVDGEPTEAEFSSDDGVSTALLEDLPDGTSTIEVSAGDETATLEVTNHPLSGPVFSGERLPMATCTTERFGLGESSPPECFADTRVIHSYVDSENRPHDVSEFSEIPADAKKVEVDGKEIPLVLRTERGVLNRAVYEITSLDTSGGLSDDFDNERWNERLVYRFGGGCGTTFTQGFIMAGPPSADLLVDGYAFATATLNTYQVQCNDILSAETAMMVKEHFVETYGEPVVTIGSGGSGGAIQQTLIAQNYPGILDAIGPTVPFPDSNSIAPGVTDCALLIRYYGSEAGTTLDDTQRQAINGHGSPITCITWDQTFVPNIDPTACALGSAVGGAANSIPGLEDGISVPPPEEIYHPETNPEGIRCTYQDSYVNLYGTDDDGFALRPLDNVGVQYGLSALRSGSITFEQFIDLNENIGGFDIDAKPTPERMVADSEALEKAYESGRVIQGGTPISDVPIIALNVYTDLDGDIHDRMRMFSLNERLKSSSGEQAPNYVMWTQAKKPDTTLLDGFSGGAALDTDITRLLDEWATALVEDTSSAPLEERLAATRPAGAQNTCFDADGEVMDSGPGVYEAPGPCTDDFPVHDDPRTASGAPLRNDIGKCQLMPVPEAVDSIDYGSELDEAQIQELERIYPEGVCDWSRPGVGQVQVGGTWRSY